MSNENVQKQILIRISEQYHTEIKRISDEENKSMNQYLVDLIIKNIDSEDDIKEDENDSEIIAVLKGQLEEKDNQIEKLHELLSQQQILNLNSQKETENLRLEMNDQYEKEDKRSFWARLFRS